MLAANILTLSELHQMYKGTTLTSDAFWHILGLVMTLAATDAQRSGHGYSQRHRRDLGL